MCHQHADVLTMKLPKLGPDGLRFHGAPRNAGSTLPKWVYFESGGLWECFFLICFWMPKQKSKVQTTLKKLIVFNGFANEEHI